MDKKDNYSDVIINFAGDEEALKKFISYFYEKQIVDEDIKIKIDNGDIVFQIPKTKNFSTNKEKIKCLLKNYLDEYCKSKKIIEFQNVFVVGVPKHLTEIAGFVQCEICGFPVNTEEELLVHRRIHGII